MAAGLLDRRIVIEQNTPTTDAFGAEVESWSTLDTVWAQIMQPKGREVFEANQVVAEVDVVFRIRWRSDVTAKMRVSYGGETYDIAAAIEVRRQRYLDLAAKVLPPAAV